MNQLSAPEVNDEELDDRQHRLVSAYLKATDRKLRINMLALLMGEEVPPFTAPKWPNLKQSQEVKLIAEQCLRALKLAEYLAGQIVKFPVPFDNDNDQRAMLVLIPTTIGILQSIASSMDISIDTDLEEIEDEIDEADDAA